MRHSTATARGGRSRRRRRGADGGQGGRKARRFRRPPRLSGAPATHHEGALGSDAQDGGDDPVFRDGREAAGDEVLSAEEGNATPGSPQRGAAGDAGRPDDGEAIASRAESFAPSGAVSAEGDVAGGEFECSEEEDIRSGASAASNAHHDCDPVRESRSPTRGVCARQAHAGDPGPPAEEFSEEASRGECASAALTRVTELFRFMTARARPAPGTEEQLALEILNTCRFLAAEKPAPPFPNYLEFANRAFGFFTVSKNLEAADDAAKAAVGAALEENLGLFSKRQRGKLRTTLIRCRAGAHAARSVSREIPSDPPSFADRDLVRGNALLASGVSSSARDPAFPLRLAAHASLAGRAAGFLDCDATSQVRWRRVSHHSESLVESCRAGRSPEALGSSPSPPGGAVCVRGDAAAPSQQAIHVNLFYSLEDLPQHCALRELLRARGPEAAKELLERLPKPAIHYNYYFITEADREAAAAGLGAWQSNQREDAADKTARLPSCASLAANGTPGPSSLKAARLPPGSEAPQREREGREGTARRRREPEGDAEDSGRRRMPAAPLPRTYAETARAVSRSPLRLRGHHASRQAKEEGSRGEGWQLSSARPHGLGVHAGRDAELRSRVPATAQGSPFLRASHHPPARELGVLPHWFPREAADEGGEGRGAPAGLPPAAVTRSAGEEPEQEADDVEASSCSAGVERASFPCADADRDGGYDPSPAEAASRSPALSGACDAAAPLAGEERAATGAGEGGERSP
ncbi:hypothetical protein BESB_004710 [Besnoitia besnoiti]|uniref:Uncharacterized protein n=1 Tax=Besnoitia besnoiti TaxID=94643 RepID=A0A2A9MQ82_BESBE|nr:hypothetical protein BESB_004710 [Besnoitia besnoiti]PFH38130.1 hypothetical protein BESB_004710 [Besnoitia besnoiti]